MAWRQERVHDGVTLHGAASEAHMKITTHGPGDDAPPEPMPDVSDTNSSMQDLGPLRVLVVYYAGDSYGLRCAAADIEITDVVISGHAIEPGHFALETLCEWQQAIADEINAEADAERGFDLWKDMP